MTRHGLNNRVARLERQRAEAEQLGGEILAYLADATPDEVDALSHALRERLPPFGPHRPEADPEMERFRSLPPEAQRREALRLAENVQRYHRALDGADDDDE